MPGLAAGLVGAEVNRQSYLLSFIDIFAFLAASLAVALPLVLLMRHFKSDGKHRPMVH